MMEHIALQWRNKKIEGRVIDLIPVAQRDLPEIVRMRNQPKSIYFFNQASRLTLEMQEQWFQAYLQRDNDLYWGIFTKNGEMAGTQRIYDIKGHICEQGSTVIDEEKAMSGPYAAEAILLSTRFAFDVLGCDTIINCNRNDNKNMNSISRKIGFTFIREKEIHGITYLYYELYKNNFNEQPLIKPIDFWMKRNGGNYETF